MKAAAKGTNGASSPEAEHAHRPSPSAAMRNGDKSSDHSVAVPIKNGNGSSQDSKIKRIQVSYNVAETLDRNLAAYCAINGVSKTKVVNRLIGDFLRDNGLDPNREPRITY